MRAAPVFLLAAVALIAGCTGNNGHAGHSAPARPAGANSPDAFPPISGTTLSSTGLRFISDGSILDLDSGRTIRVAGLAAGSGRAIDAFAVDGSTVISAECTDTRPCTNEVFVLAHDGSEVTRLASHASGAPGRAGVWISRELSRRDCTLSEETIGGRTLVPPASVDCGLSVRGETKYGILASSSGTDDVILDPTHDFRVRYRARGRILAVAGSSIVTDTAGSLAVTRPGGRTTELSPPSTVGGPGKPAVSPDSRYVSIEFANPACPGPQQCLDLWVLDLVGPHWIHVPSMPVVASLKETREIWAGDDRLFILGVFGRRGGAVARWSPADTELSVRTASLPPAPYGVIAGPTEN